MRAAELKDIDELSYVAIGKQLGIGQTPSDKKRGDNSQVRNRVVRRGRAHFEKALGKEGYKEYVEASQAEIARRQSQDEVEHYTEDFAEAARIPVETMRRIMTATRDDLSAWLQTLDPEHPDDRRIFLAIMFGRAWYDFFESR
jgi:hypothetical protein